MQKAEMKSTEIEIEAETEQTRIYSDGSAHIDDSRGACATIVSLGKRHHVQTRALRGEQWKNYYCAEL